MKQSTRVRLTTNANPEDPMLKVTIELVSAITKRTSAIGVMFLSNDGQGTRDRGSYDVRVMRKGVESPLGKATREGRVEDYPRLAYNVWRLIGRALHAAFPEEREPGIAKLDARVMRGLNHLAASGIISDHEDIVAARAWLDAGNIEPDDNTDSQVSRALGCNMPDGDAREAFQRSIFSGLKLIARSLNEGGHEWTTNEQREDVNNAMQFVAALPE